MEESEAIREFLLILEKDIYLIQKFIAKADGNASAEKDLVRLKNSLVHLKYTYDFYGGDDDVIYTGDY